MNIFINLFNNRTPCQNNFLDVLNDHMNKIDSVNNEIYIPGEFKINLSLIYLNFEFIKTINNSPNEGNI